jgi:hypothetical protein
MVWIHGRMVWIHGRMVWIPNTFINAPVRVTPGQPLLVRCTPATGPRESGRDEGPRHRPVGRRRRRGNLRVPERARGVCEDSHCDSESAGVESNGRRTWGPVFRPLGPSPPTIGAQSSDHWGPVLRPLGPSPPTNRMVGAFRRAQRSENHRPH